MSFGTRLKQVREAKGYTRKELALELNITTSAISNYENSLSSPKENVLLKIFDILDVDPNFLFQDSVSKKSELSENEKNHIEKYRSLDSYGKKAVNSILDIERERVLSYEIIEEPATLWYLKYNYHPASAGTGTYLTDEASKQIAVPQTPMSLSADSCIRVSGDSMEPTYQDGDIVLIKEQDTIEIGEVGVFVLNGEGYIKELGVGTLISYNKVYDDITFREHDDIRVTGKVIGFAFEK